VEQSAEFQRPSDLLIGRADPTLAKQVLGWEAKFRMKEVVHAMIEALPGEPSADKSA
jgi:GDPmannose 4,6-dehydratase